MNPIAQIKNFIKKQKAKNEEDELIKKRDPQVTEELVKEALSRHLGVC
jgi:hypothetical protein